MKHLKRNIVFVVLGMVFCSGFLCGNAWAVETITPDYDQNSHYTLTCEHSYNQYYRVVVDYLHGGSHLVYNLDANGKLVENGSSTFVGSAECEKRIELFKTNLKDHNVYGTNDDTTGGDSGDSGVNGGYEGTGTGEATILKRCDDKDLDGQGRIECLIDIVVNVFTAGIGILGVTGIIIVGIQYLTAGGDEAKMTKAKRRMYEIVIGLVLYMLGYALLKWLLPTYN